MHMVLSDSVHLCSIKPMLLFNAFIIVFWVLFFLQETQTSLTSLVVVTAILSRPMWDGLTLWEKIISHLIDRFIPTSKTTSTKLKITSFLLQHAQTHREPGLEECFSIWAAFAPLPKGTLAMSRSMLGGNNLGGWIAIGT